MRADELAGELWFEIMGTDVEAPCGGPNGYVGSVVDDDIAGPT
jgi:hypothetical protein